ncbi:MAG: TIGR00375 family protein [Methanosarcinaceae archaeon]
MLINADLHLHSKYSMACSERMELPTIAQEAKKKGIDLVATGDCIHPQWLKAIKEAASDDETIVIHDTHFILTTEIEDRNRVHHLLILPSIAKADELAEEMAKHGNLTLDGRPTVRLDGCQIAEIAKDVGALIGPCHAFTPWTALYAAHDTLQSCYQDMTDYISFVELGLSADTDYADRIDELHRLTFLSNSDAHSPWSNKLAREFTRFEVPQIDFEGIEMAILRKNGCGATLNVGLFPQEGKYNRSACSRCHTQYTLGQCRSHNWRCPCGGQIKKGVFERVQELADHNTPQHPEYRPPYLHLMPLAEIIMMALGHASISTKGVKNAWESLVRTFGSEVAVLLDADLDQIGPVDSRIVDAIAAFRNNEVIIHPGGGGKYGWIELPQQDEPAAEKQDNQSSLFDF